MKMKFIAIILVFLTISCSEKAWIEYGSADEGYTIEFPEEAYEKNSTSNMSWGNIDSTELQVKYSEMTFYFIIGEYPDEFISKKPMQMLVFILY